MYKVVPFMHHPLPHIEQKPQTRLEVKLPPVPPTATYWTYPITSHASRDKQPTHKTYIMATLNATPDSFSLPDTLSYAALAIAAGANIVDIGDIGGYSTRPGAAYVPPDDEFSRVIVPIIQAIRDGGGVATPTLSGRPSLTARIAQTLISVDTFR